MNVLESRPLDKPALPFADGLPNLSPAHFVVPTREGVRAAAPFTHAPRFLILYGSLRERSFSRFLAHEARRAGWRMSRRTAWSLCSSQGITSAAQRRRRGKGRRVGPPVFDDHVKRVFTADAPNQVWLTDITEHPTREGKLYCCAIKDVYANRIVVYSISDRMTAQLAVDALKSAVTRRRLEGHDVAGCILHADRGSQFRSRKMAHALNRHAMVGSMGRVGAAGDNAAMESFWSLLQTNVLNQRRWATRQQLRLAIVLWIERKYHRQRPQDSLGGLTPIEYENKITIKAAPAA